jgi:hypothetical protein
MCETPDGFDHLAEFANFIMLCENGLQPEVARRVARQWCEKCIEVERLQRAAAAA